MKKYRLIIFALLAVLAVVTLTGCGQGAASADMQSSVQQTQGETQAQAQSGAAAEDKDAIYGNVTAIDGNNITLELGTVNQGALPDGQDGAPPSGAGQGNGQDGGQPSGMPSDMPSGEQPSGMPSDMPSGGERPSMLSLTGETKTITVSDESVIATTGSDSQKTGLAAIQVGSTVKVVYAQDGETIQSITVMNGGEGFPGSAGGGRNTPGAS
jgi:hypothetical protein